MLETSLQETSEKPYQKHIISAQKNQIVCIVEQCAYTSSAIAVRWKLHNEVTFAEQIDSLLTFYSALRKETVLSNIEKLIFPKVTINRNGYIMNVPFGILLFDGGIDNCLFHNCTGFQVSTPYVNIIFEKNIPEKNSNRFSVISSLNVSSSLAEFISSTGSVPVTKSELEISLQNAYTALTKKYLQ